MKKEEKKNVLKLNNSHIVNLQTDWMNLSWNEGILIVVGADADAGGDGDDDDA